MVRSGLIARKLGMSRLFEDDGSHRSVTVLKLENVEVVNVRDKDKDGYVALQLGSGIRKSKHLNKPQKGYFGKQRIAAKEKLVEFRVSEDCVLPVGSRFSVDHYVVGQKVDVSGISIGKGFAGAMKRHNFSGLRATHGVSISHRSHGSTGQNQDPGRVFKGKKMAGHMGSRRVTVQNLTVAKTDNERNLIYVEGAVPGHSGAIVSIKDAVKVLLPDDVPFPAGLVKEEQEKPVVESKVEDKNDNDVIDNPVDGEEKS